MSIDPGKNEQNKMPNTNSKKAQVEKSQDPEWLAARNKGKQSRRIYTDTLQECRVQKPWEFAKCTDSIYQGLTKMNTNQLYESKGLEKGKDNLRDNLETTELIDIAFTERLSAKRMTDKKCKGFKQCADESYRAGDEVRKLLNSEE